MLDINKIYFKHAYTRDDIPDVVFGVFGNMKANYTRKLTEHEIAILNSKKPDANKEDKL